MYYKNLPVFLVFFFFTLNTVSCFIQSMDVEAEAGSGSGTAVNFLCKRKHFDERDWKRKRTRKRLILSGAGRGSKKFKGGEANSKA